MQRSKHIILNLYFLNTFLEHTLKVRLVSQFVTELKQCISAVMSRAYSVKIYLKQYNI